jgi:type IV pilus assembly protein PilO
VKEKIENMPILIFLVIGLAIAGYNYMGNLSVSETLEGQISQLKTQLQEKKDALTKAQNSASEVPMMKEEINNISQSLSKATELIPTTTTPRSVLEKISKEAKDSGVKIIQSAPAETVTKNYFDELPISAEFEGSYAQLTLFMYLLSKQKLIIQPGDMELTTKQIVDGQTSLKLLGKLSGFKYKETKQ